MGKRALLTVLLGMTGPFMALNCQERVTESSGSPCIPTSNNTIRQVFTARAAAQAGHHCI